MSSVGPRDPAGTQTLATAEAELIMFLLAEKTRGKIHGTNPKNKPVPKKSNLPEQCCGNQKMKQESKAHNQTLKNEKQSNSHSFTQIKLLPDKYRDSY